MTDQQTRWIAALRSGLYPQATSTYASLREPDGYTPYGVACELALDAGIIAGYDPYQAMPVAVQQWLGLRIPYACPISLDDMQDGGKTFAEIADAIEAHPELFYPERVRDTQRIPGHDLTRLAPMSRAQLESLRRVYQRGIEPEVTFREFRRSVHTMALMNGCVLVRLNGMWLGIERDGYAHS